MNSDSELDLAMAWYTLWAMISWPGHLVICLLSSLNYPIFNLLQLSKAVVSFTEIPVCENCQCNFAFALIQKESRF